jgi:hypothetical protein
LKSGRIVFEIKGENNAKMLSSSHPVIKANAEAKILNQSANQMEARGGRAMVWVFAEKEAAEKAWNVWYGGRRPPLNRRCTHSLGEEQSMTKGTVLRI